jgi:hypothetical protein
MRIQPLVRKLAVSKFPLRRFVNVGSRRHTRIAPSGLRDPRSQTRCSAPSKPSREIKGASKPEMNAFDADGCRDRLVDARALGAVPRRDRRGERVPDACGEPVASARNVVVPVSLASHFGFEVRYGWGAKPLETKTRGFGQLRLASVQSLSRRIGRCRSSRGGFATPTPRGVIPLLGDRCGLDRAHALLLTLFVVLTGEQDVVTGLDRLE